MRQVTTTIAAALLLAGSVPAQVQYEDILKGAGQDWLTYSGTYQGSRYSTLKQITRQNASSLVPVWTYHVPEATGLRTTPIVYKGIMYVTNSNAIFAVDARTGRRSTALATNIDFGAWADYLGDPPLAAAFLDRLVDGAVILKLTGRSYRAHRARRVPEAAPGHAGGE